MTAFTKAWATALALLASCSAAYADTATNAPSAARDMFGPVLIGVLVALASQYGAHVLAQRAEQKKKDASQAEVIRHYLAPLADASEKIIWRLREVFEQKRHYWLMTSSLPLDYNQYKRHSTLYRIAVLLGWLRAIDIELSTAPRRSADAMDDALVVVKQRLMDIRSVLADGTAVELQRLQYLIQVWNLDASGLSKGELSNLALKLEMELHRLAGGTQRANAILLTALAPEAQFELCHGLCKLICDRLGRPVLDDATIKAALTTALDRIPFREAWIYRDWQDCIGDAVLRQETGSLRRFNVIGFEAFAAKLAKSRAGPATPPWYLALESLVTDVDFEHPNPNDFRTAQLRNLTRGVANLLIAIDQRESDLVGDKLLEVAKALAV